MFSTTAFATYFQWSGIGTIALALICAIAFIAKWGFRYRLVGTTGFMAVLTVGLFALSLVPLTHTVIPGAVKFTTIYDNGNERAVIRVNTPITETQLDATLKQAAVDLFSYGRAGGMDGKLHIRARTVLHSQPGIGEPLMLGEATRNLRANTENNIEIEIDRANLAKVSKSTAQS